MAMVISHNFKVRGMSKCIKLPELSKATCLFIFRLVPYNEGTSIADFVKVADGMTVFVVV
jgi:hypothetical protein